MEKRNTAYAHIDIYLGCNAYGFFGRKYSHFFSSLIQNDEIKADVSANTTIVCNIVRRNEKNYATVKSLNLQLHVTHLKHKSTLKDIGPFITGILFEIAESNWKLLLEFIIDDLEVNLVDVIKSFFTPIFDKISLEEFSDGQSNLETLSVVSDSKSSSSNSSSSNNAQKLTSSILAWWMFLLTKNFSQ